MHCPGNLNSSTHSVDSLKNLRRERDMLYKQMLKKLTNGEKERVYARWGIDLSSKQRRLQLSRLVWTQTDMEHIRESASLVAKLIELLEPAQALKEMFGLNFTLAPRSERRSFGLLGTWKNCTLWPAKRWPIRRQWQHGGRRTRSTGGWLVWRGIAPQHWFHWSFWCFPSFICVCVWLVSDV